MWWRSGSWGCRGISGAGGAAPPQSPAGLDLAGPYRRGVELKHLTGFVAVAEELHFGRAAERLHIAQSPLSQQIKLLERDLGVKLFDRTTRTVRLTSAGQALVEPARRLLADASAVRRTVRAAHLGEVGRVSVGFAGASSYAALPLLTRAVTSQLPGIELVLEGQTYSGEALRRGTDGPLDIG